MADRATRYDEIRRGLMLLQDVIRIRICVPQGHLFVGGVCLNCDCEEPDHA